MSDPPSDGVVNMQISTSNDAETPSADEGMLDASPDDVVPETVAPTPTPPPPSSSLRARAAPSKAASKVVRIAPAAAATPAAPAAVAAAAQAVSSYPWWMTWRNAMVVVAAALAAFALYRYLKRKPVIADEEVPAEEVPLAAPAAPAEIVKRARFSQDPPDVIVMTTTSPVVSRERPTVQDITDEVEEVEAPVPAPAPAPAAEAEKPAATVGDLETSEPPQTIEDLLS